MPIELIYDLHALQPQWLELYQRTPDAAPFQHPAWLLPWWEVFGSGRLFTLACFEGRDLAALFPAFLHLWQGQRQITFLGNGASDQMDLLGDSQCCRAVWNTLTSHAREWDTVHLESLPASSVLARPAQPACATAALELSPTFHQSLPSGLRRNLRRYREKLSARGQLEFRSGSFQDFNAFLELHRKRWRGGVFDGPLERFHREAARRMWSAGRARLRLLCLDQRPIAGIYGFVDKGRFWSYQSGYDPEFATFSPGALVLQFAMQEAVNEGCAVFDFLRGNELYKLTWGARFATNYSLRLCHTAA